MENTKRFLSTGVALAIALFASVNVSQISAKDTTAKKTALSPIANKSINEFEKLGQKRNAAINKLKQLGYVEDRNTGTWARKTQPRDLAELNLIDKQIKMLRESLRDLGYVRNTRTMKWEKFE